MAEEEGMRAAPHGVLLVVVSIVLVAGPMLLGDQGEAISDAFAGILGPPGLLLLPVLLIIAIRVLSSERGLALSEIFSAAGEPNSIHRLGGSPVGVTLLLLLLLFLLYSRVSLFGTSIVDGSSD